MLLLVIVLGISLIVGVCVLLVRSDRREKFGPNTPPPSVTNWTEYPLLSALNTIFSPLTAPAGMSFLYPVSISGSISSHYYDINVDLSRVSFNTLNFGTPVWTLATETSPLPNSNAVAQVVVPMSGTLNLSYQGEIETDVPLFGKNCQLFSSDGSTMTLAYSGNVTLSFVAGPYDPSISGLTYVPILTSGLVTSPSLISMLEAPGNVANNWLNCYSTDFSGLMTDFVNDFINQSVTSTPGTAPGVTVSNLPPPPYPQCMTPTDCSADWTYACVSGTCIPSGGSGPECPGGNC